MKLFLLFSHLRSRILTLWQIVVASLVLFSGSLVSAKQLSVWKPVVTDSGLILQGVLSDTNRSSTTIQFRLHSQSELKILPLENDSIVGEYRYVSALSASPVDDSCVVILELIRNGLLTESDTLRIDLLNPAGASAITLAASVTQAMPQDRDPGVTLNGVIAPHDLPTRYYFEYGVSGVLNQTTANLPVGGALNAVYEEDFESGFSGLLMPPGFELMTEPNAGQGMVAAPHTYSSFQDFNHRSGIGTIFLTMFGYTSDTLRGFGDLGLGGGSADFRDAMINLKARTENFHPNGSKLRFWIQSLSGGDFGDRTWVRANWFAESFCLLPDSNDEWQSLTAELRNTSLDWIYAGTDLTQQRNERYAYWPLDSTLGKLDTDFLLTLSAIDSSNPPTGNIYFDDFSITYRNSNLLTPLNGATLVQSPIMLADPASLTDGHRVGESHCWSGSAVDSSGHVFVYQFDSLVSLDRILLAQHSAFPTDSFRCEVSLDGQVYHDVWTGKLDPTQNSSPHLNFMRVLLNQEPARFLRIQLLSGYQSEYGLAEIEAYGSGAALNPGQDSCYVNADIRGFQPGEIVSYRLVAENARSTSYGLIQHALIPADSAPLTITEGFEIIDQVSARVKVTSQGRGKSGNLRAQFRSAGDSIWRETSYRSVAADTLQFASHHWFELDSLSSGATIEYRSVFETANGADSGRIESFVTPFNHKPVLVSEWNPNWNFADTIAFSLAVTDQDSIDFGDIASVTVLNAPAWMTWDSNEEILTGLIPFETNCRDSVILLLSDNKGAVDTIVQEIAIEPLSAPVITSLEDGDILQLAMPSYSYLVHWSPGLSSPSDSFAFSLRVNGEIHQFEISDTVASLDLMSLLSPGNNAALWINRFSPAGCLANPDTVFVSVSPTVQQAVQAIAYQLDFGDAARGSVSYLNFELSNAASEDFVIDSISKPGGMNPSFAWKTDSLTVVPADQVTQLRCEFRPQSLGLSSDSVEIWTRGGIVRLSATGNSPSAVPVLASDFVEFGSLLPDSVQMKLIEIQKSGLNALRIVSVEGLSDPFAVSSDIAPVDILDTNRAIIPITFVPQIPGEYLDTLSIQTNGSPSFVSVVVHGVVTVATDTGEERENLPSTFALHQNYPNPFNPSTTISYDLPHRSRVTLKILNILGQEVDELVQSEQTAGYYSIVWQGDVSSGVYFAKIQIVEADTGQRYEQVTKMLRIE